MTSEDVDARLRRCLQRNVSNNNGGYYTKYPLSGDEMVFGNQAINVRDFLAALGVQAPLSKICLQATERSPKGPVRECPLCGVVVREFRYQRHLSEKCPRRNSNEQTRKTGGPAQV
jgi:hypothetical protein